MFEKNVFVISGELGNPKISTKIKQILKDAVPKRFLKLLNTNNSLLEWHIKEMLPSIVLLHKTNGRTRALQKVIEKHSSSTRVIHITDDLFWPEALITLKTLIAAV